MRAPRTALGRIVDRAIHKAQEPKVQTGIRLFLVAMGFGALKQLLEDHSKRLEALEERGLVPLDDLVTVRDVAKIDRRVWVLEGEPGPDPAAAFPETLEPAPESGATFPETENAGGEGPEATTTAE